MITFNNDYYLKQHEYILVTSSGSMFEGIPNSSIVCGARTKSIPFWFFNLFTNSFVLYVETFLSINIISGDVMLNSFDRLLFAMLLGRSCGNDLSSL